MGQSRVLVKGVSRDLPNPRTGKGGGGQGFTAQECGVMQRLVALDGVSSHEGGRGSE